MIDYVGIDYIAVYSTECNYLSICHAGFGTFLHGDMLHELLYNLEMCEEPGDIDYFLRPYLHRA